MNRGWDPILPGLPSLYAPQPINDRPAGLGFPHRAGRCRPGRTRFSFPRCRSCRDVEGCMNRGWEPILPGLPSVYAPQPISDRPVELGFPHRSGRFRPRKTRFSSPRCRGCRDVEGCLNRGWSLSSLGCPRSTRPSRSAIGQWDWGFHTVRAGVDPG